ncbi:MAG: M28 family peptidase [Gemmatimonadaceae bacterium]
MLSIIGIAVLMVACGGDKQGNAENSASASTDVAFDGDAALGYVREQLAFGPRVPGSAGHRNTGDWITRMMRARADTVIEQRWTHVTHKGDSLPMRNVLARFRPAATERVLYVTHWDTRPKSDGSGVPKDKRNTPIPGANDGASGVGMFVALGDVLKKIPPSVGVDLLFVDGEDYGEFGPPDIDVLIGAKYFAGHLPSADYAPLFGVLWDMIGDRDLKIEKEENSLRKAPEVVARVWEKAASLGYGNVFVPTEGLSITDDHIPLLEAKLRVIDVIDLDYPWHHTPDDTIDKVSAKSLKTVGDVAWALVK